MLILERRSRGLHCRCIERRLCCENSLLKTSLKHFPFYFLFFSYGGGCFLLRLTVSRLSTCSSVCELSKIFVYAAYAAGGRERGGEGE